MLQKMFLKSKSKAVINNDISIGMLNHAYLISCDDVDKLIDYSKMLACMILCRQRECAPCFECDMCKKVICGTHADVLIYPKGKILTVEDAKAIANDCFVVPMESDKKVIIINNLDLARTDSQNKLLKTLEEPPKNVIFILTCSNIEGVLPTIRSRVKIINEVLSEDKDIVEDLSKVADVKVLNNFIEFANGSVTKLNEFLNNKKSINIYNLCFDLLMNLKKSGDVLKYSYLILEEKENLNLFFNIFSYVLGEILMLQINKEVNLKGKEEDLKLIYKDYPISALVKLIEKCGEINQKMKFNCNPTIIVDNFLLYILEVKYLCCKI